MKIVAKISDSKFLVEATTDELANVAGYRYASQIKDEHFRIGCNFQVRSAFTQLEQLSKIRKTFADTKKQILQAADLLDVVQKIPDIESPERE